MLKQLALAAIAMALIGTGCGRVMDPLEDIELNSLNALIKQSSNQYMGSRTISIRIPPAQEGAYTPGKVQYSVQAAHRWTRDDIHRYELTLKVMDASGGFVDVADSPAVLRIDPRLELSAVFANLKPGETYEVTLVAKGNLGGTASATNLNTLSPTRAVFAFPASGSERRHQGANMQAALDPTPIDPQADLQILPAAEGEFHNGSDTVEVE